MASVILAPPAKLFRSGLFTEVSAQFARAEKHDPGERPLMHDQVRDVALRLLWAARDIHVEHQSEKEWPRARFRARTTLDL